jgi:hypothetical protein
MNNMKTVSAFYLVCIFIVLFTDGINAIRTPPDAELKVVSVTFIQGRRARCVIINVLAG